MTMTFEIICNNLNLTFANPHKSQDGKGDIQILQNCNWRVACPNIVSLQGQSGSGKTSLLMILAGLLKPTSGQVIINNCDLTKLNTDELAKFRQANIGMIYQQFHLLAYLTALENVALPLYFQKIANAEKIAMEFLDKVGLGNRAKHFPRQLSGGEQQRVAIARALAVNPKLLLADEPTGNLDPETGENILKTMFELANNAKTTIILVTHDALLAQKCQIHYQLIGKSLHFVPNKADE